MCICVSVGLAFGFWGHGGKVRLAWLGIVFISKTALVESFGKTSKASCMQARTCNRPFTISSESTASRLMGLIWSYTFTYKFVWVGHLSLRNEHLVAATKFSFDSGGHLQVSGKRSRPEVGSHHMVPPASSAAYMYDKLGTRGEIAGMGSLSPITLHLDIPSASGPVQVFSDFSVMLPYLYQAIGTSLNQNAMLFDNLAPARCQGSV
ncbi:hypothetical protein F5Y19DRAFT_414819 [Xylariaceae sp. FL1651]|nr:hypothetical protein F5Y19DRAFT_414819 [Xylariaceae sp. FL1651]